MGVSLGFYAKKRTIMSHKFIFSASFHLLLVAIDRELSELVQKQGCPCGGRLDQSNYPRSPMGVPSAFRPSYDERFSLCCNDCRKRITPASVRFFSRRWYPAPLLILISTLMLSINEYRLTQIKRHFGITVTESTWNRWRRWWRDVFTATLFWKQEKPVLIKVRVNQEYVAHAFEQLKEVLRPFHLVSLHLFPISE